MEYQIKIDEKRVNVNESNDNYRYNDGNNAADSARIKLENEQRRTRDSLQKVKENIDQQIEKIDNGSEQTGALISYPLQSYLLLVILTDIVSIVELK
jgi:hypothetical protein